MQQDSLNLIVKLIALAIVIIGISIVVSKVVKIGGLT